MSQLTGGQTAAWIQRAQDASQVNASALDTLTTATAAPASIPFPTAHSQPRFQSLGEAQGMAQAMGHPETQRQAAFHRAHAALSPQHGSAEASMMIGVDDGGPNNPTAVKTHAERPGMKRRREDGQLEQHMAMVQSYIALL